MKTITTFILLMLCVAAQARLNETLEQCEKRYGLATGKDADKAEASFEKAGISITAHFHQGKVDFITFRPAEGAVFSTAEVHLLTEGNLGKEWRTASPLDASQNETALYSHDQSLRGYVRTQRKELVFFTFAYLERTEGGKIKEGDAGRRLNGF